MPRETGSRRWQPYDISTLGDELDVRNPTPCIYELFNDYNQIYFECQLGAVFVEWSSNRMTMCGGTTQKLPGGGALIRLSKPLLSLRPTRDLKCTLLHEMIHAWIMVNNLHRLDGDPTGHGVVFHAKAAEINASTSPDPHRPSNGYQITQFHSMIDEVEYYRQHHWKCEKCGNLIRRSMNRAPQPADCRHNRGKTGCNDKSCRYCSHAASCGGKYIKIKEPENFKDKNKKRKSSKGNDSDASMPNSGSNQAPKHLKDQNSKSRSIKDFFGLEAQEKPPSKQYVECESNLSEINQQGSSVLPAFEKVLNWTDFTAASKTLEGDRSKHLYGNPMSDSQDNTLVGKTIQDQLREIAALRKRHWEVSKDEKSRDTIHAASSSKSETSIINAANKSNDSLDSSWKAYSVKDFSIGVPNDPSQDLINLVSSEDEEDNSKVAFDLRNCSEHKAGDRNVEELNQNIHVQFICCPVCNLQFASDGHSALNEHLDRCLIRL